ncbi:hypothetical protein [Actinoplanes sp. SE50/110]|uniref:hypothetical protein n=1 Tax=Actinoplanes sp. (strain ATCC 31044 / CBS 674.73 / SE50/110) TaxID=134676 RepID=UPI0005BB6B27|nr:hypothetical protein [Actinoplanes sp. SE50/110]
MASALPLNASAVAADYDYPTSDIDDVPLLQINGDGVRARRLDSADLTSVGLSPSTGSSPVEIASARVGTWSPTRSRCRLTTTSSGC